MKSRANYFKRHFLLGAIFFAMVFLCFSRDAKAATITWDGSSSTDWATAANWVGDVVPTSTDDVVINGSYTNAPTLNLSAGAVTVNSLSVGSSATSVLTVSNGDIDTKKLIVTGDVTIGASGTLTHTANSSAETHRLSLQVGGNMTVASGGTVNLNNKGYTGTSGNGRGPGAGGGGDVNQRGSGGGHGGKGASTTTHAGGTTYDSVTQPAMIGSSGGTCTRAAYGGAGGGAAKIAVAGTLTLEGTLTAVGGNGITDKCSGGGSGGAIWVVAGNLTGAGSINANGGTSFNSDLTSASGGGGGRIAIEYTTNSFSGAITAFGKTGYVYGGAGTIYLKQGTNSGDLIVDNNSVSGADTLQLAGTNFTFDNVTITKSAKYVIPDTSSLTASASLSANSVAATITVNSGGTITLPASKNSLDYLSISNSGTVNVSQSNFSISNGTITNNGTITGISNLTLSSVTFYQNGTIIGVTDLIVDSSATLEFQNLTSSNSFNLNNLTVKNGGAVNHKTNSSTEAYTLNLDISGNLDIQLGGIINLNSRGYAGVTNGAGQGPGAGLGGGTSTYGGGGSYGGKGGNATGGYASGSIYGSDMSPIQIGSSAGGGSGGLGGAGGGAAKISVGGTLNVTGSISCNGGGGSINSRAGGGSGGSIFINANYLTGNGSLSANGGNANTTTLAGGGGGGRILILYGTSSFSGTISANGGTGYNAGNAGTIRTGSLSAEVLSSPYDSGSGQNVIAKLQWTETLPAGTDAKFQIRTAPDNSGVPGTWTSWMGPNGTSGTYFTDPSGGEDIPAALEDGANDQWMQYRVLLSSPDLSVNPVISDVSLFYVVNQPPNFDATFGTNGINLSQVSSSVDPQWGKMKIEYAVRDVDTTSGTVTQNYATPSFEYSFDGSNWTAVNSAYVTYSAPAQGDIADVNGDGKMDNKMLEGSHLTYAAYWNAKSQIPETYSESIRVRVTVTDNEIANSTVQATGNVTSVDTKNPTLASVPMHVHANSVPASVSSDVTDDNSLQMKIGLAADISDASWESYAASKQLTLATNPDVVYAQYRDAFGNSSVILSAQTPEQPATVMIQDTSNMHDDLNEYRLFVAWKTIATPEVGFGSYYVYRSENQTDWTHVGTVNDRLTNYYGDNSVQGNVNYYYRVASVDASGDVSYVSAIVNGVANGNVDAGEGGGGIGEQPPAISNVSTSNITSTSASITWDTDKISDSAVAYITTNDGNFANAPIRGVATLADSTSGLGKHNLALSNLNPATTYYLKLFSTDTSEMTGSSDNSGLGYSFTTLNGPAISTVQINPENQGATITWNTNVSSVSKISYAQTIENGQLINPIEIGSEESKTNHSQRLADLNPGTTYYFSIAATDSNGALEVDSNSGSFYAFVANDLAEPVISGVQTALVSADQVAIHWETDEQATTQIKYATQSGGPYTTLAENIDKDINHYAIIPGLAAGTRYYYKVISKDIAGNESVSAENDFKTSVDPSLDHDPLDSISDIEPSIITDTKAVISFKTDQTAQCFVEYGTQAGQYTEVPIGESIYDLKHSLHLAGLIYQTKYYYRITCSDNLDTIIISDELSFTTLEKQIGESETGEEDIADRIAPSISNVSVKAVASESAVISWDTDENANSMIRFGTSSTYGKMTGDDSVNTDSANYVQNHEVTVDRLVPGTKYYFEAMSLDANGNIGKSSQGTFTTEGTSTISSIVSESKELGKATVMWLTQVPADTYLEYGVSTKYGSEIKQSSLTKEHQVELSGLKGGSIYHFRIKGTDADGNIYTSADSTFEPKSPPKVRDLQAVHVSEHSATITFTADVPVTATVNYQDTRKEKEAQSKGNPNLGTKQEIILNDLESGLTYSYTVTLRDENGLETISEAKTFVTGKDTSAPIIDQVKTESALTQNDKVQSIISWKTDEFATGALVYREGKNGEEKEIKVSDVLSQQHVAVVTSFNQGSVYYFRVKAVDASDNEAISSDYALLTPKTKENIVQVIISNFYDIFRWTRR